MAKAARITCTLKQKMNMIDILRNKIEKAKECRTLREVRNLLPEVQHPYSDSTL